MTRSLLVTNDFPPKVGGIQSYLYELWRRLPSDETVVLTTAHLDHTPENCDPANLRAMCQGCHLHYDRDHHRETAAATRRAAIEAAGQLTISTET